MPAIPSWDESKYYCISLPHDMHIKVAVKGKKLHLIVVTKNGKKVHFVDDLTVSPASPFVEPPPEATSAPDASGAARTTVTLDGELFTYDDGGSRP